MIRPLCVSVSRVVRLVPRVETIALLILLVSLPLAPAKRPVPPVIVLTSLVSLPAGVSVPVPVAAVQTLSPLAATSVAVSVRRNVSGPVSVNDVMSFVNANLPRCESRPLPGRRCPSP